MSSFFIKEVAFLHYSNIMYFFLIIRYICDITIFHLYISKWNFSIKNIFQQKKWDLKYFCFSILKNKENILFINDIITIKIILRLDLSSILIFFKNCF